MYLPTPTDALMRQWYDYVDSHPAEVCSKHTALYHWTIKRCQEAGWRRSIAMPTALAMNAMGVSRYETYKKTLHDLVRFGFIEVLQYSTNQHTDTLIALLKNSEARCLVKVVQLELKFKVKRQVNQTKPKLLPYKIVGQQTDIWELPSETLCIDTAPQGAAPTLLQMPKATGV